MKNHFDIHTCDLPMISIGAVDFDFSGVCCVGGFKGQGPDRRRFLSFPRADSFVSFEFDDDPASLPPLLDAIWSHCAEGVINRGQANYLSRTVISLFTRPQEPGAH